MKVTIKQHTNEGALLVDQTGTEQWFKIAQHIDPQYVHDGEAEVTIKGEEITFVKSVKKPGFANQSKPGGFGQKKTFIAPQPPKTKQVEILEDVSLVDLKAAMNEFYKTHDCIASQIFPCDIVVDGSTKRSYDAIIYYNL